MAAATTTAVKEIERLRVSPPPGSVPSAVIELSFFDVIWVSVGPVTRLFFFRLPDVSTDDFRESHFPALVKSLSLALKIFYPLAGKLIRSPDDPDDFVISYDDGDSVLVTLAESAGDFDFLTGDRMRDVEGLRPLEPVLVPNEEVPPERKPLLALQVTVFPGSGVCIGITVHHTVADGTSSINFVKSWASIFKTAGGADDSVAIGTQLPTFDRSVVGDLRGLKRDFYEEMKRYGSTLKRPVTIGDPVPPSRVVLATFHLTRSDLQKLRDLVSSSGRDVGPRPTTFQLSFAYTWTCAIKARGFSERKSVHAGFAADFRTRISSPVPGNFFGNCIGAIFVEGSGTELSRDDGIAVGSELIHRAIRKTGEDPLRDAVSWITRFTELSSERILSVAGSPRLRVHETDFGWGPPKKVEIMSILNGGAISLAESRDVEAGGVEIGFGGPEQEVELFASFFEEGLGCL